ncbi:LysR family transcriptional regulator [Sphingomonas colocasiae]|uniref:LysR family transcriptional regulator n=1 Tax=Sphingomonas colocasiae TaxID=1848973 RepID=A0ABS7PJH4_9SPHN|nr:LysR substrate-binding domain-containing protein [Sphingomonas colocasiae]MBY8821418.1 LysR family transcriptional regulator [Sphingomonas colocasiae]
MFDWDDLRVFLAVARARRMAPAARTLGVDATTIGRRLTRLSDALGAELFESVGIEKRLTDRGQSLFRHAEAIESAALAAMGEVAGESRSLSGQVRLSVAEGFGTWVLAPALPAFHRTHPDIQLDVITASGFLNPSKREADMAVMLARPRSGKLVASKLGDYRLRLYASRAYLATHGRPERAEELKRHTLISYVPEFIYSPELDYLGEIGAGLEPKLRSSSINIQHRLVSGGAGIGMLPGFIGERDPDIVPLLVDEKEIRRSYWLVTHSDTRGLARIEAVADLLHRCTRQVD